MMKLSVSSLVGNYKELLAMLTVDNPEYKSARFFGKGFVKKDIPKKLFFFRTDDTTRSIKIPRNIDNKYFNGTVEYSKLSFGSEIRVGYNSNGFKLRPHQDKYFQETVFPYINSLEPSSNIDILLNSFCGSGKTVMALYLASVYRRKTIVCVTTKKIGKQFIQSINDLFPNWACGWAEDKKEYDITLGTYALLSSVSYTEEYFSNFGHIILDEFHRCGADTYSRVLEKAPCKYRTSLTATFRRKDRLHKILRYHAGKVLEMEKNEQKAIIYPIKTGAEINEDLFRGVNRFATKFDNLEEYSEICVKSNETKKEVDRGMVVQINKPQGYFIIKSSISMNDVKYLSNEVSIYNLGVVSSPMIDTEVSENEIRTDIIVYLIREAYRKGRKTIVLSKRKEQLYSLAKVLTRYGIDNGVFVSDKAPDYKKYCEANGRTVEENAEFVFNKTRVILGIDKLAEEGMDAPKFDTLIYAHPIKDIEQSIGRILRENPEGNHPAKQSPIAFYLIDKINSYNKSFYGKKDGAKQMFEKLGHKVVDECTIEQLKQLDF